MKEKQQSNTIFFNDFERKIVQRLSLDIRYFCDDDNSAIEESEADAKKRSQNCRQPVTDLPDTLAEMIAKSGIGGVVLFAENVQTTEQVVKLTHDLQHAALSVDKGKPLIISMDQEGGRVARFAKMTGFSGNMAIGASYDKHQGDFATQVNATIAKELSVLGINNNYAPVVDVNTNAENPVINTRSYGESADRVSTLGINAVKAIQAQGVMATLKHFPGHGDTHVDSHLGLPRVDHDLDTIYNVDLKPFAKAIKQTNPAMVMTAHIQYPALDDSVYISNTGESFIRPATMSRKILTGVLRNELAFEGIIASDALDMAGISHYFTEVEAVVETFVAGADLAVMPYKVRTQADIDSFYLFIKQVAKELESKIASGSYQLAEFEQSVQRLTDYKARYIKLDNDSYAEKFKKAELIIAKDEHLAIEQSLANAAVTLIKNESVLPLNSGKVKKLYLVVATQQELLALTYAIREQTEHHDEFQSITIDSVVAETLANPNAVINLANDTDLILSTLDIKTASLVDLGGMDDLVELAGMEGRKPSYGTAKEQAQKVSYGSLLKKQLQQAKTQKIPAILIAKGSPFLLDEYSQLADAVLLNYDDRIYQNEAGETVSPGFNASMAVITNRLKASGKLPVSLANP